MSHPTSRLVVIAACAAVLGAFGLVGSASASRGGGPACTLAGAVVNVHAADTGPTMSIDRSGAAIMVNDTACGTVTTVDSIDVDLDGNSSVVISIRLDHGKFAPGLTTSGETGAPEIEFDIHDLGIGDILFVNGSAGSDLITVGERTVSGARVTGIEMNGIDEGFAPDDDVIFHTISQTVFLEGMGGADYLSGRGTGALGSDVFTGPMYFSDGPGQDTVLGGDGSDEFAAPDAQDEGDSYSGFAGKDSMSFAGRNAGVRVTLDDTNDDGTGCVPGPGCEGDNVHSDIEVLRGGPGPDGLFGLAGNQDLDGAGGNNFLRGGPGNDVMSGGSGTNDFGGGTGVDTVSFFGFGSVVVTLDGLKNDGGSGMDNVRGDVENVLGGNDSDQITGNAKANHLQGGGGNDTIDGSGGNDVLDGGGTPAGFGGTTQDGNDVFLGGPGKDTVVEHHHGPMVLSIDNLANDRVPTKPQEGTDNIHTDVENVTAVGTRVDLTGSAANNVLVGTPGDDGLTGFGGNDVLVGAEGSDTLTGGPGLDTAKFAASAAAVKASIALQSAFGEGADDLFGLERLTGSKFGDTLTGSAGPNLLTGGGGPDTLKGLAGDDRLVGGGGNDHLDGGPDSDTCLQGPGSGPIAGCEH